MNGDEWVVGREIFGSFIIRKIRNYATYTDYVIAQSGCHDGLVVRVPLVWLNHAANYFLLNVENIQRLVRLGMHPHLEACFGFVAAEIPIVFFENLEGSTLSQWLATGKPTLRSILSVFIQICHGLEHLHTEGLFQSHLSPDRIIITAGSLAKIQHSVSLSFAKNERGGKGAFRADIRALSALLRLMLSNEPYDPISRVEKTGKRKGMAEHLRDYASLLKPVLLRFAATEKDGGYPDIDVLRNDLNVVYYRAFGQNCPYLSLETNLKAEGLNNQAVVDLATGKLKEAFVKLQQALIIKDRLPEAVYNLIVCKFYCGIFPRGKMLAILDAVMAEAENSDYFNNLKKSIQQYKEGEVRKKNSLPVLLFCPSPTSLSLYRQEKEKRRQYQLIETHFHNLHYEASLRMLLSAWGKKRFARDHFLSRFYNRLLAKSDKKEIVGVQRSVIFPGTGIQIKHLSCIPKIRKIVESGGGDTVRIRDYAPGRKDFIINTEGQSVTTLAASPDGSMIVIGTDAGEIIFSGTQSEYPLLHRDIVHQGEVNALSFSNDGRFLATGGVDGILTCRSIETMREKRVTACKSGGITCLAFVADGLELVSANEVGEIMIWSARGKKCRHKINAHDGSVDSLAISKKGDFFATAGSSDIKIWDMQNGECLRQLLGHPGGKTLLLLLDDNRHLISTGMDDMVRIYDLVAGERVALLDGRGKGIGCIARGSQPHVFFTVQQNGTLQVWQIIYNLSFD